MLFMCLIHIDINNLNLLIRVTPVLNIIYLNQRSQIVYKNKTGNGGNKKNRNGNLFCFIAFLIYYICSLCTKKCMVAL